MKNRLIRILFLQSLIPFLFASISFAQPATWQPRGPGGGGSLFFPTINPANDNEFYVTCDMSQLFHSTDFGNSYEQVPFSKLQVGNISTYEFTNNSNIAYCIANDGNINYAVRTINGGNSWAAVPGNPLDGEDVFSLKADYDNPARIVLGYYDRLYFSNDTGKTFTLVRTASGGSGLAVAGVFFESANIYIGTNEGLLVSSNGGSSFSLLATTGIPASQTIFSMAGARQGGVTRLFCVTATTADVYNIVFPWDYYNFPKGVYSIDAGSTTWVSRSAGINFSNDFMMYVSMARNDINTVYLGGSDATTGGNSVMKTINAGASWSKIFLTSNNQNIRTGWSGQGGDRSWGFGETCFGITVAPNNAQKILFGDYGFVHRSSDGGASWQQAYVNTADEHPAGSPTPQKQYYRSIGLENTTCWQIHWQDAANMFACYSDINGARSTNGGLSWGFDYTGHTINTMYRIAKQSVGSTMFAATSGVHDMYQSTRLQDNLLDANDPGGRIIFSTNNGAAWQLLHQFGHPVFWVATDPNNANRMYASVIHYNGGAGQGGIWVTDDLNNLAASIWTKLPNPPRTQGHPASILVLNDGSVVATYSGRRTSAGAFTASSGVFLYDPATGNWTDVSHSDMQYWTKDIVIDPSDPAQNTWWVCVFSGWGGAPNGKGGLFKTTNRGASWTKLTGTQFDRVTSITFNPSLSQQAYLTTEVQGLFISNNMSAATPIWTSVANYPFRQPERVFFNPFNHNEIWVSSFGNGMKTGTQSLVLPVKLTRFSGNRDDEKNIIGWTTTGESKGDGFSLEKSGNGRDFSTVYEVPAKGGDNTYSWNEQSDGKEVFYRLRMTNLSGHIYYSKTIRLLNTGEIMNAITILGNPVSESISLKADLKNDDQLSICLFDQNGRMLLKKSLNLGKGVTQFTVQLPATTLSGIYILKVQSTQVNRNYRISVNAK